jgi:prevent-host-death family protein
MDILTANNAKQNFGELMDRALQKPVSITKHGRPSVVVTSDADYQELLRIKYAHLQAAVRTGFDEFDQGHTSKRSAENIADAVLKKHKSL